MSQLSGPHFVRFYFVVQAQIAAEKRGSAVFIPAVGLDNV